MMTQEEINKKALEIFPYTDEGNVEDDIDAAKRRIWADGYIRCQFENQLKNITTEEEQDEMIEFIKRAFQIHVGFKDLALKKLLKFIEESKFKIVKK